MMRYILISNSLFFLCINLVKGEVSSGVKSSRDQRLWEKEYVHLIMKTFSKLAKMTLTAILAVLIADSANALAKVKRQQTIHQSIKTVYPQKIG